MDDRHHDVRLCLVYWEMEATLFRRNHKNNCSFIGHRDTLDLVLRIYKTRIGFGCNDLPVVDNLVYSSFGTNHSKEAILENRIAVFDLGDRGCLLHGRRPKESYSRDFCWTGIGVFQCIVYCFKQAAC